jgi:hypothetical protein
MDIATGNWFNYLNEEILTEGLRDIGLPESVIDFIENAMSESPEKSKMYVGNEWKKWTLNAAYRDRYVNEVWYPFLERNFRDQIQVTPIEPHHRKSQFVARIMAPYDIQGTPISVEPVSGPRQKRVMYDEETVEQNKRIVFVAQNVANAVAKPAGTWRKAFAKAVKALSKAGIPSEKVEVIKNELDRITIFEFRSFWNRFDTLFAWLNDEPTNYELIKGEENIFNAETTAQEDLNNKEDPSQVLHQFDDGSYWYDLEVSNCPVEGERMGHCGSDSRGTLVSLRKRQGKRKASSSYITMTWSDETIYQIKGRSNEAPPEETWPAIAWFIDNMNITNVEESGEHSNDIEGIQEMTEWLSQNTTASFHGNVEERMEAIEEAVNGIDERFHDQRNEIEWSSIGCQVEGGEEYGGNINDVYLYMSCDWSTEIDLGWEDFTQDSGDGMYTATLANGDHAEFESIPTNTYGSESREFESDLGLGDLAYELPGENPETEWEVTMMVGAQAIGDDMDPDPPATAHLRIRITNSETETANDDNDAYEYDQYVDTMLNFDGESAENMEKIRLKLSSNGYIAKSAYDLGKQELESFELNNFKIYSDDAELEFWFQPATEGAESNLISYRDDDEKRNSIPAIVKLYEWDELREANIDVLYSKMFGGPNRKNITNDTLNANMARAVQIEYNKRQKVDSKDQMEFPFGDKHVAKEVPLVLARDSRFIIVTNTARYPTEPDRLPLMNIQWKYTLGVKPNTSAEEIETIKGVVKFLDENPDIVLDAGNSMIAMAIEAMVDSAEQSKKALLSNTEAQRIINDVKSTYGPAADLGDAHSFDAEKRILIVKWIEANWGSMNEPEKYVAMKQFLIPFNRRTFRIHANIGSIEVHDENNVGKPVLWDELVATQYRRMGAGDRAAKYKSPKSTPTGEPLSGTLGEPVPAGGPVVRNARGERMAESIEEQIARVDRLLSENVDVRLYKMQIDAVVNPNRAEGGSKLLQDELRSIEGVTVVSVDMSRDLPGGADLNRFNIKFSLQGQRPRLEFVEGSLLPSLRRVSGFEVKDWSAPVEVTPGKKLKESQILQEFGFGGVAGNLGAQRFDRGNQMPTPRPLLQTMVDDWVDGGVMAYDVPTDTTDMRYNVMMPVEELLPYISQMYRGDMRDFTGRYHEFIKNGATAPVYVAIGMNGRVKITGGEDIVWFAKKSGLAEVPVFFSYQKQV